MKNVLNDLKKGDKAFIIDKELMLFIFNPKYSSPMLIEVIGPTEYDPETATLMPQIDVTLFEIYVNENGAIRKKDNGSKVTLFGNVICYSTYDEAKKAMIDENVNEKNILTQTINWYRYPDVNPSVVYGGPLVKTMKVESLLCVYNDLTYYINLWDYSTKSFVKDPKQPIYFTRNIFVKVNEEIIYDANGTKEKRIEKFRDKANTDIKFEIETKY